MVTNVVAKVVVVSLSVVLDLVGSSATAVGGCYTKCNWPCITRLWVHKRLYLNIGHSS